MGNRRVALAATAHDLGYGFYFVAKETPKATKTLAKKLSHIAYSGLEFSGRVLKTYFDWSGEFGRIIELKRAIPFIVLPLGIGEGATYSLLTSFAGAPSALSYSLFVGTPVARSLHALYESNKK